MVHLDVTDRATAAGWTLPEGFTVTASLDDDDRTSDDPREWGDCYVTDVDEVDYDHPTRGFCKHCGTWIRQVDDDTARVMSEPCECESDLDVEVCDHGVEAGDWTTEVTGISCPGTDDRRHELDNPLTVQWWNEDRWTFVGVSVTVRDAEGRTWGDTSLWGIECGQFPSVIDPETGLVQVAYLDPLEDAYPLDELLPEALRVAQSALATHSTRNPVIIEPAEPTVTVVTRVAAWVKRLVTRSASR